MRWTSLCLALLLGFLGVASAVDTAQVPLADGFDLPVGKNGKSYYKARSVRPNGHLGEDWNGIGGGNTDLGDEIYSSADGIVTFAQDYRLGWGNVVIIRSAYIENGDMKYVDSLYGHLLDFSVRVGELVKRGQQIARMGNNRGMYEAHLHFEMRKNINVGMFRSSYPRDWSIYWSPTEFVAAHRSCPCDGRLVAMPVNTYPSSPPPIIAYTKVSTPTQSISQAMATGQVYTGNASGLRRAYAVVAASRAAAASGGSVAAAAAAAVSSSAPPPTTPVTASSTSVAPSSSPVTSSSTSGTPSSPPASVSHSHTAATGPKAAAATSTSIAKTKTASTPTTSTAKPKTASATTTFAAKTKVASTTTSPKAASTTASPKATTTGNSTTKPKTVAATTTSAPGPKTASPTTASKPKTATTPITSAPGPKAVATTATTPATTSQVQTPTPTPSDKRSARHPVFRVQRFEDMRVLGYDQ